MAEKPVASDVPRLVVSAAVVGALATIVGLGIFVGASVTGSGPVSQLVGGSLAEIHVTGDAIYLGTVVDDRDGYLRVARPAVLTEDPGSDPSRTQLLVRLLTIDPYDLAGDVLIASDQITLLGPVIPGSGLERAYRQATGDAGSEGPAPSPQ